ncbi:hypothetical protein OG921_17535 [Aldersonia sp. NBC_00410]|uniref:hypothetical protein n=1 Tax=Aldersonia sp. NBC_00410 TaxID=2975954 RepID=UPI0022504161|nr:hypothetical protein [Aldersonia sp. NBC_00410]MCX5044974.1 hypothetical protein [Aldersonia sp. NBC_00410]
MLALTGCTTDPEPVPPTTAVATPPATPSTSAFVSQPVVDGFAQLEPSLPGVVGIAVAPVGGSTATVAGAWSTGVAWSTIKVPLALAALRANGESAASLADSAIMASDNAAAEGLWSLLGDPPTAAQAVGAVLAESGDSTTHVQSERVRPEFTAFGQTEWSLAAQALFTAHLPCLPGADAVTARMATLIPDQQWGLARIDGAVSKAGWGPGEDGKYLVRQLAVLSAPQGQSAVTVAVEPESGNFADGIAILDRVAAWLGDHLDLLPYGICA